MQKTDDTRTGKLIAAIVLFVIGVAIGLCLIIAVGQYREHTLEYDDLISVDYTFERSEYYSYRRNEHYEIFVTEEEKPLRISSVYLSAVDEEKLASLVRGDRIACLGKESANSDFRYEAVQIVCGDTAVMTMESYRAAGVRNSVVGLIVISVFSLAMFSGALVYFVAYLKSKGDNDGRKA